MTNILTLRADGSIDQTIVDLGAAWESVEVASDAFAFATSMVEVDGEGGAADDLATITGGGTGKLILLKIADADHPITLKHMAGAGGNLWLPTLDDITLDDPNRVVALLYTGSVWSMKQGIGAGGVMPEPPADDDRWLTTSTDIAVFCFDSTVHYGTLGSTLSSAALSTTRIKRFVPDYTSPLLAGTGSEVHGWFIGGSTATNPPKLYRIEDIGGANTVTELFDILADTPGSDAGLYDIVSVPGFMPVVLGYYAQSLSSPSRFIRTLCTLTTTDGEIFTRNDITPDHCDGTGGYILDAFPANSLAIDPVDGDVYAGYGVFTSGISGSVTPVTIDQGIHKSINGGASFDATPAYSASVVPYVIQANEGDVFWGLTAGTEYLKNGAEVHLVEDGVDHRPAAGAGSNQAVSILNSDPTRVAAACDNHASSDRSNFISSDGGENWTVVASASDYPSSGNYHLAVIMPDDPDQVLWIGRNMAGAGQSIYMITDGTSMVAQGGLMTAAANTQVVGIVRLN